MEIELVKQMPPKSSGHNADVAEGADAAELNGAWESNSDACEKKSSSSGTGKSHCRRITMGGADSSMNRSFAGRSQPAKLHRESKPGKSSNCKRSAQRTLCFRTINFRWCG